MYDTSNIVKYKSKGLESLDNFSINFFLGME
jgi:hypothetical protein